MDNSLGEYPKLVDALSESLETVLGAELNTDMWQASYLGYLCRYSSHTPMHRGWSVVSQHEVRLNKNIWRQEMLKLARQHWIGWNHYQKFDDISVNVFDGG